ncbi:hypothetical protein QJ517_24970 [Pseudomonas aeruginosa]|uniref:hypothetical protein n=1 Tax=Pseudomonas aeruginosa TaxID=287 RepID=UPI00249BE5D1|nr:hypothetical protein [Pseudomonas aeruginosa]MDI2706925.1 hypothetical protein [Pseudomonas aeruginosa]
MNEANECTCPSGDGSLVHPCPAHPAVEQAGKDERIVKTAPERIYLIVGDECPLDADFGELSEVTWCEDEPAAGIEYVRADKARAALAQPSPAQAEAERPEVAGYRSKESGMVYEQDYGLKNPEALTTVAECERIVGALRADRDSWAEQAEQRLADWDEMRKERDAAQARVAELEAHCVRLGQGEAERYWENRWRDADARLQELEKQEPVATVGKVPGENWNSLDFHQDLQTMTPGQKLYTSPAAQAQHSVPEGWKLVPIEPLLNMMSDKDHDTRITAERQLLSILADAPGNLVPQAWLDVQAERRRQITAEGWTPEHDDEHDSGELAAAGAAYALHAADHLNPYSQGDGGDEAPSCWPWHDGIAGRGEGPEKTEPAWWKPSTPRRDLVKACALALAEIEHLDRACISQSPQPGATTASS